MDIGNRLKAARQKANFTQGEAAEALGVSRQTVSNWENNKTYPELSAVVNMSDLYELSLDELLKENTEYIRYINNSTQKKSFKLKLSIILEIIIFFAIWIFILVNYYVNPPEAYNRISYVIFTQYILFPIFILSFSIIVGIDENWGRYRWFLMPVFAYAGCFMDFCTFNVNSLLTKGDVFIGFAYMYLPMFAVSFIGIVLGIIIKGTFVKIKTRLKNGASRKVKDRETEN